LVVREELACYTIHDDGTDGCRVHGENGQRLDGAIIRITDVFTPESENSSVRHLYHHNHGYAYAIVLNLSSAGVN
jgi:hypothetical protein